MGLTRLKDTLGICIPKMGEVYVPISLEITQKSIKTVSTTKVNGEEVIITDENGDGIPETRMTISTNPMGKKSVKLERFKSIDWEIIQKTPKINH